MAVNAPLEAQYLILSGDAGVFDMQAYSVDHIAGTNMRADWMTVRSVHSLHGLM